MVIASGAARTTYAVRQEPTDSSTAVSGANTVEASPPTSVTAVSARTRRGPPQWVSAANAGGHRVADMAAPARPQAARNHGRVGAAASASTANTPTTDPMLIRRRGP